MQEVVGAATDSPGANGCLQRRSQMEWAGAGRDGGGRRGGAPGDQALEGSKIMSRRGRREGAASSRARVESKASLVGKHGIPGVMRCDGTGRCGRQRERPDAFRAYGTTDEEVGVVQGVNAKSEHTLLSFVEV